MLSDSFGIGKILGDGDALIIVPPFTHLSNASLGSHLLQASAKKAGFRVRILYANMLFAGMMGAAEYAQFCRNSTFDVSFHGERMFARSAFGLEPFGKRVAQRYLPEETLGREKAECLDGLELFYPPTGKINLQNLEDIEAATDSWADRIAAELSQFSFKAVGCTSSYQQTNSSITIFKHLKIHNPEVKTLLGGANCAGIMADGISTLDPERNYVDYIFSGESESTFVEFLDNIRGNRLPDKRIILGNASVDLDGVPDPDYTEYFSQLNFFLPDASAVADEAMIVYETSRGCWWGRSHNCTFCGLNLEELTYRQKSHRKVVNALKKYHRIYPGKIVCMSDNVMPRGYLPPFSAELPPMELMYTVRSSISLETMTMLKKVGITYLGPGIESFDSKLLSLMNKGVTAKDNLLFLRNAKSLGLSVTWNFLWAFPGEEISSYEST